MRVPAIVSGGALPAGQRGGVVQTLFHVCDWLPTLIHAATGSPVQLGDAASGRIPYDGLDQWPALTGANVTGPRTEVVLDHCLQGYGMSGTGCNHFQFDRPGGVGALIVGNWKLVAGPNGGEWSSATNGTKCSAFGGRACDTQCLFDLSQDPSEHYDLSAAQPDVLAKMLARFGELVHTYHPPATNPAPEDTAMCAVAAAHGNFLQPWAGPTPPAPPVGPCIGGSGTPGWEVSNHTGGGGPGFAPSQVADLSAASVATCRARWCASPRCVSVTLHTVNSQTRCYLNPPGSAIPPFAKPDTLMAFVNRSEGG